MSEANNFPINYTNNTKLKWTIAYPSAMDLVAGAAPDPEIVAAVVEEISVDGIGYPHEHIHGLSKWSLGLRTKAPTNKNGRILVSELDDVYRFLRWLAKSDEYFDLKVAELNSTENPSRGQWIPGNEILVGCKVEPYGKSYGMDGRVYAAVPYVWTKFAYAQGGVFHYIGNGFFSTTGKPTNIGTYT